MALEMKSECERCSRSIAVDDEAYICSFECTFCAPCQNDMAAQCPNCGGELLRRPRRATEQAG